MNIYQLLDIPKNKLKVYWSDTQVAFSGTLYMVVNQKSFDCRRGKARKKSQKAKESIKSDKRLYKL